MSNVFAERCQQLGLIHERIPPRTPDLNAFFESFHSTLDRECYSRNEFETLKNAYAAISRYMEFYNERRRHGSLGQMSPATFRVAFADGRIAVQQFVA